MSSFNWPVVGGSGSGGGVTVYTNIASFPASGNIGDVGIAQNTGIMYEWFGGAWTPIAGTTVPLSINATANGLSLSGNVLTLVLASSGVTGALSGSDWTTFNSKQSALSFSSPLVNTAGTISIPAATSLVNGYLSSVDWSTFNGKQAAGSYITGLTSDVSASGPGSATATVNSVGGASAANIATATGVVNTAQSGNKFLASPANGSSAAPAFRVISATDIPTLNQSTSGTAALATAPSTGTAHGVVTLDTSAHFQSVAPGTAGHYLRSDGTDWASSTIQAADVPTLNQSTSGTAANVTGVVALANGGSGQISAQLAMNAFAGAVTSGKYLRGNGTNVVMSDIQAADVPTLNQSTSGTAANVTGTVAISNGGTGQTTASAAFNALSPITATGDLILGNGVNSATKLSIGTNKYVLTAGATTASWQPNYQSVKNYLQPYAASTGGGAINIGNGDFELNATTGWIIAHTALSATLAPTTTASAGVEYTSSTGTASGNLSIAITTAQTLSGAYSLKLLSSAASTAGDMLMSRAFYIDSQDTASVMSVNFAYNVQTQGGLAFTGIYNTNSFAVWIYDMTNGAWIPCNGAYSMSGISATAVNVTGSCTFQTSSNGIQYQLAIINQIASTGAYELHFDSFSVSPQIITTGAPITDWVSYTPVFTGFGTVSTQKFQSRRVGDSLEIIGKFTVGTPTAVQAKIELGYNGISGNVSTNSIITSLTLLGNATVGTATTTDFGQRTILGNGDNNYLNIGTVNSGGGQEVAQNGNAAVGAGAVLELYAKIPIAGWSSNVAMSSDVGNALVELNVSGLATNLSLSGSPQTLLFNTINKDTSGIYSSSNGYTTILSSGYYNFAIQAYNAGTTMPAGGILNLSLYNITTSSVINAIFYQQQSSAAFSSYNQVLPLSVNAVWLPAGTQVAVQAWTSNGSFTAPVVSSNATETYLTITKAANPQTIAASEKGYWRAYASTGMVLNNTSPAIIYNTKLNGDSSYNTTTGVWTSPRAGLAIVTWNAGDSSSTTTRMFTTLYSGVTPIKRSNDVSYPSATANTVVTGTTTIPVVAGQQLNFTGYSVSSITTATSIETNSVEILLQ